MIKKKNILVGQVIKKNMEKSATVIISRIVKHPMYGKFINKKTKLHIHDENNLCSVGDLVEIYECRPISKTKSWNFNKIIKKNIV